MEKRKMFANNKVIAIIAILCVVSIAIILTGCGTNNNVKTYEKEVDEVTNKIKNESYKNETDNKENAEISTKGKLSEEEALKLGVQLYNEALDLNNDEEYEMIDDYVNVSKTVEKFKNRFTENGLKQYLECCAIYEEDGVYYLGGKGSDPTYLSHEIKVKKVEEDKIEYTIVGTYNEEHDGGTTEKFEYSIVRNGDKWTIDEFATPW